MEEIMKTVCSNPWCKATFIFTKEDMTPKEVDIRTSNINSVIDEVELKDPTQCPKCRSFDIELSGGVEWKDREYEGDRFDGTAHQIKYKVTNYK